MISGSRLYPVEILVPTLFEQDKFSSALRDLKKIELCRNRTVQLVETTFSVLLHRAFTGELTATWREAHLKELLSEMEIQSKVLSQGGAGGEYR